MDVGDFYSSLSTKQIYNLLSSIRKSPKIVYHLSIRCDIEIYRSSYTNLVRLLIIGSTMETFEV